MTMLLELMGQLETKGDPNMYIFKIANIKLAVTKHLVCVVSVKLA